MDLTNKNAFSDENLNDLFDLIHVAVDWQSEEGKALSLIHFALSKSKHVKMPQILQNTNRYSN